MNQIRNPHRRAVAALLSATALIATPAIAQEAAVPPAAQTIVPPRVVPTVSDAPTAATQAASTSGSVGDVQSATPVNSVAAEQAAAEQAERRAERPSARPVARQAAPRAAATRAAAKPAAVVAPAVVTPTSAPVAVTPAPAVQTPAATTQPATATPEAAPAAMTRTETTTTETSGMPIWPFALIGLLIVAAGTYFFLRRRNSDDVYEDAYIEEPVAQGSAQPMTIEPVAAAPVAAAAPAFLDRTPIAGDRIEAPVVPVVPEDATVATADEEDVAALTAAAPVERRPWLEFAMRPVRAGTNADEALVEIELTVGNAGEVRAEDVRISTFMLQNDEDGEMERLLTRSTDAAVDPVSIDPGEGTRVDATLAMRKSGLTGKGFQPIVVADARYRLPDGGEGRTSASFLIGVSADGGTALTPIQTARPQMREDIEAHLYGEPQHV